MTRDTQRMPNVNGVISWTGQPERFSEDWRFAEIVLLGKGINLALNTMVIVMAMFMVMGGKRGGMGNRMRLQRKK